MFTKILLITAIMLSVYGPLNNTPTVVEPLAVRHEYPIYGVRTKSGGNCTEGQDTDIFSYNPEQKTTKLLFSDKKLPVVMLHTIGGGVFGLHYIVATSLKNGKLYARMVQRDQYGVECDPAGSFYEISTNGTNTYRKLFDFDNPENFYISPDGTKIASYYGYVISIRNINTGKIIQQIDLNQYSDGYYIAQAMSWAPDGKTILVNIGDTIGTIGIPDSKAGCYQINIANKEMKKLTSPFFQTPQDLTSGYKTDPFKYVYMPNSNQLVGESRKYVQGQSHYLVKLFKLGLNGSHLQELVLGGKGGRYAWMHYISPNGNSVAYQCGDEALCTTNFQNNFSEVISPKPPHKNGLEQHQTIIGWFNQ